MNPQTLSINVKELRIKRSIIFVDKYLTRYKGTDTSNKMVDLLIDTKLSLKALPEESIKKYCLAISKVGLEGIHLSPINTSLVKELVSQFLFIEEHRIAKKEIHFGIKEKTYKEFLNSYISPFILDYKSWPSVTHYYEAMKFNGSWDEDIIRKLEKPSQVLYHSKNVVLEKDWDIKGPEYMFKACKAKFQQNDKLRKLLVDTSGVKICYLSENKFWGHLGKNLQGKILMQVRFNLSPIPYKILNRGV